MMDKSYKYNDQQKSCISRLVRTGNRWLSGSRAVGTSPCCSSTQTQTRAPFPRKRLPARAKWLPATAWILVKVRALSWFYLYVDVCISNSILYILVIWKKDISEMGWSFFLMKTCRPIQMIFSSQIGCLFATNVWVYLLTAAFQVL